MKILHTVESYSPSVGGMQEAVRQISEHLVKRGHQVTVATSRDPARKSLNINGVIIREFSITGNHIRGIEGEIPEYQQFLTGSDFDIITNFAAQQWATDLMLPLLDQITAKKIFVPTGFSALQDPAYQQYFESMKTWMKLYDRLVFLSNTYRDIEFARNAGIGNGIVIPNGAAEEEFCSDDAGDIRRELGIPGQDFLILHVGSHTRFKGHAEAIDLFRKTRLTNVTFIIVGNIFSKKCYYSCKLKELVFRINPLNALRHKQFLVRKLTRQQTIRLFKAADLFLFPSNIECSPIVLFECMASRTPFLTSDVGNAREIIEWSGGGELLPTKKDLRGYSHIDLQDSVKILETLYQDKDLRTLMQNRGHDAWVKTFNWKRISERYEQLYRSLSG